MINAAKHSQGKSIFIDLSRKGHDLLLTVRDTGVGSPPMTAKSKGMGRRIMQYRADMIGATLKFASIRGRGTKVTCRIPIPEIAKTRRPPREGKRSIA